METLYVLSQTLNGYTTINSLCNTLFKAQKDEINNQILFKTKNKRLQFARFPMGLMDTQHSKRQTNKLFFEPKIRA